MGRQRVTLAVAAAVFASGCVPRYSGTAGQVTLSSRSGTVPAVQRAAVAERKLSAAELRVRELETELAERDRQIAAVRGEMNAAQGVGPDSQSRTGTAPEPPAAAAAAPSAPAPEPDMAADAVAAEAPAPPPASTRETGRPASSGSDAQLADAQQRIASLQERLTVEVQRRKDVEGEMARLLQETSSGPFERNDNAVDKHLQQELDGARQEIAELRTTLATERRQRSDLERSYSALQAQVQRGGGSGGGEEVEALKTRQRRVLASIQQDLEASRQRERELRETLEHNQGNDAVSLADAVSGMRSENVALQRRLDEEHRQNRDLQAKLKTATRVTDLIFKMQSAGGSKPGTAAP
ncbi:MAG: hypothetical protein ABI629_14700 [bacterium]